VPHLFRAARSSGQLTVSVDLLGEHLFSPALDADEPLRLAASALRGRFDKILAAEGFNREIVTRATLTFRFDAQWPQTPTTLRAQTRAGMRETPDDPAYHCEAAVVATNGRVYREELRSWHFEEL
jgi:hypothetical protein